MEARPYCVYMLVYYRPRCRAMVFGGMCVGDPAVEPSVEYVLELCLCLAHPAKIFYPILTVPRLNIEP